MHEIAAIAITSVLAVLSALLVWDRAAARAWREGVDMGRLPLWIGMLTCALVFGVHLLAVEQHSTGVPQAWALACLFGTLAGAAAVDIKRSEIPNIAPAILAVAGVFNLLLERDIAAVGVDVIVVAVLLTAVTFSSAWRLGPGDWKLCMALGLLFTGVLGAAAVLLALIGAQVYIAVARRRLGVPRHGPMAFAPFLAGSTLLVLWVATNPAVWPLTMRTPMP